MNINVILNDPRESHTLRTQGEVTVEYDPHDNLIVRKKDDGLIVALFHDRRAPVAFVERDESPTVKVRVGDVDLSSLDIPGLTAKAENAIADLPPYERDVPDPDDGWVSISLEDIPNVYMGAVLRDGDGDEWRRPSMDTEPLVLVATGENPYDFAVFEKDLHHYGPWQIRAEDVR
jgi:hypothetical protein